MHYVSICGKLQPQDHRMSFCNSQVCSPETQRSQNRQQQQQLILQQVLDLQFSSLAGSVIQKHCRVWSGLATVYWPICLSISNWLTACLSDLRYHFKFQFFVFYDCCCFVPEKDFPFFLLIFPSSFLLFYGIDCLLVGSKVRQITSSLLGGLTGTWK